MGKRSKGITVFAWVEIVLGAIGSLLCILTGYLTWFCASSSGGGYAAVFMLVISVLSFPLIFILITGIFLLKLKSWARMANIIILMALAFFVLAAGFYLGPMSGIKFLVTYYPIISFGLFLIITFSAWFLTRFKVKEQFKK